MNKFNTSQLPNVTPKGYAATLGSAANELTEESILSVSIPANDWGDNEKITLEFLLSTKAMADLLGGGAVFKLKYGASSVTLLTNASYDYGNAATVNKFYIDLWRVGADIWVFLASVDAGSNENLAAPKGLVQDIAFENGWSTYNKLIEDETFATEKTLQITAQWDELDANNVVQVIAARVIKS